MRLAILLSVLAVPALSDARHFDDEFSAPAAFQLSGMAPRALGGAHPARATAPYQTSSRIAAVGDGALAIDADSGHLVRTDASGAALVQLAIGSDAGLLAYDPVLQRAYVADRRGDRVVVVDVDDAHATLSSVASWPTPAEPYGVALAPDRKTVLVTAIADRTLVAYDAATGRERWRAPLGAEPRGVAISADGARATIASLSTGAVDEVALAGELHPVRHVALPVQLDGAQARGAFAVTYLGDRIAVTAYQIETPIAAVPSNEGHYGGGFLPPIAHRLAFLAASGGESEAVTSVQEPRAVAWDPSTDRMFVAGMATEQVVVVAHASQVDVKEEGVVWLGKRCGADGMTVAANGDVLVWCALSRDIARISHERLKTDRGPEVVASAMDAQRHEGYVLFHTADANISAFGQMSCGNCHLDGRADGLSWLIHDQKLQTPMLAGRLADTAPFKWDGTAKDLPASLRQTVERLGGSGLSKHHIAALTAFLERTPPLRAPNRDHDAVSRGKQLFESADVGCALCHDGSAFTDRERHRFAHQPAFDTPSLVGVAASAPYFHDGSAPTLEAVVRDRGKIHGMADGGKKLSDRDVADLVAFLDTL